MRSGRAPLCCRRYCCRFELDHCDQWGYALRQGLWLADAVGHGDHHAARFWNAEAAKLLAPLLHAAALGPGHMQAVIGWLDDRETDEPTDILAAAGATAAQRQLQGIASLDDRNRGTIYMSAGALLAAYRHPDVLATARPGFDPAAFLDGGAHTLYICSPARRQKELAPLVVAMLSSLLECAAYKAAHQHAPLSPTLRILLDEAANIAPLSELPSHLSQAAGHGSASRRSGNHSPRPASATTTLPTQSSPTPPPSCSWARSPTTTPAPTSNSSSASSSPNTTTTTPGAPKHPPRPCSSSATTAPCSSQAPCRQR